MENYTIIDHYTIMNSVIELGFLSVDKNAVGINYSGTSQAANNKSHAL